MSSNFMGIRVSVPSCQDEHRSARLNEVTIPKMVEKIQKAVLDDRRLKMHELTDIVGISKSAVQHCRENVSIECLVNFCAFSKLWIIHGSATSHLR